MEELLELKRLLEIEKQEDYRLYKEQFLRNNIAERRKNGLTWYPIVINKEEIGFGGYLSLEIERTSNKNEPHQLQSGKNIELFSNQEHIEEHRPIVGIIKQIEQNRLKVVLTVDELPDWVDSGKLGVNILFDENSYREMNLAIAKVMNAKGERLAELRDVFLGVKPPSFNKRSNDLNSSLLNDSQLRALQLIDAAKDVAIIHGPPGTGKTTTLVQAIIHTLKTETQVLVCSPSNIAVDLLCEKLSEQGIPVLRMGNPVRVSESVLSCTLDARVQAHSSYKELKQFRKMAEEYRSLAHKYKRNFGLKERAQRQLLFAESRKMQTEADLLENYISDEQFERVQVIACTLVGSANKKLSRKLFSTVFIDEAAQALEPACWIAIAKANRVILAGDHLQLPPTIKSRIAAEQGLDKTLFEKSIHKPGIAVMLNTQYRMNQQIMGFSNQHFYNGELIAHPRVKDAVLVSQSDDALLNRPFEFVDTAGCAYQEVTSEVNPSISNPEEAALLLKHLSRLLVNYELSDLPGESLSIGIISPYKEQIRVINELLSSSVDLKKYLIQIAVKTIDGFQGQERDIIYISLTRSNANGEIGFLKDTRRMNVALTRAKKKLVVIGDSATICQHPFYNKFLNYVDEVSAYKSAWDFIY